MGRRYPRAWKKRQQVARAAVVANRLLGKRTETLFQTRDEYKWQALKSRQIGMSLYNNLLVTNPRTSFIISGMEGV